MRTRDLFIAGLGVYLPDHLVTVADAIDQGLCDAETARVGWVSVRVADSMPAPDMAVRAANQAIERSELRPEDIDLLFYAYAHHQGPDGWCPPQYVQRHTVGSDILAVGLSGCDGMMIALELAASFLVAASDRVGVLLSSADNFGTPLFNRWRAHRGIAFGDLGSALVLSRRPSFAQLLSVCSTTKPELEEISRGKEPIFPPSCTVSRPLDFESRLDSYEGNLMELAAELIPELYGKTVARALAEAELSIVDISRITHQAPGGEHLLRMATEPLGFSVDQGMLRWGQVNGRSGASDQVGGLNHLVEDEEIGPGDHVLLLGSGPGLIVSAAIVRILERPSWISS